MSGGGERVPIRWGHVLLGFFPAFFVPDFAGSLAAFFAVLFAVFFAVVCPVFFVTVLAVPFSVFFPDFRFTSFFASLGVVSDVA